SRYDPAAAHGRGAVAVNSLLPSGTRPPPAPAPAPAAGLVDLRRGRRTADGARPGRAEGAAVTAAVTSPAAARARRQAARALGRRRRRGAGSPTTSATGSSVGCRGPAAAAACWPTTCAHHLTEPQGDWVFALGFRGK